MDVQHHEKVTKRPVRTAADSKIDLTSSTDPNPVGGVTLSDGDRVLLPAQSDTSNNGLYRADPATDPSQWDRTYDADSAERTPPQMKVPVSEGNNADSTYRRTATSAGPGGPYSKISEGGGISGIWSDYPSALTWAKYGSSVEVIEIQQNYVAVGTDQNEAIVYNWVKDTVEQTFTDPSDTVTGLSIDGDYIAFSDDTDIWVYNWKTNTLQEQFSVSSSSFILSVSLDGNFVAFGGANQEVDVYDWTTNTLQENFTEPTDNLREISLNGDFVAFAVRYGATWVFNWTTNTQQVKLTDESTSPMAVSLYGDYVAYGGSDQTVWVYDHTTNTLVTTL